MAVSVERSEQPQQTESALDLKDIKAIVDLMKRSDLTEFEIEEEGLRLRIARQGPQQATTYVAQPAPVAAAPVAAPAPAAAPAPKPVELGRVIKSPIVGTYYGAPSPDSPAFVKVGSVVTADTVVCIIEAMKVMNEIKAELNGTIAEILVQNGAPVEYGQPLFRIQ